MSEGPPTYSGLSVEAGGFMGIMCAMKLHVGQEVNTNLGAGSINVLCNCQVEFGFVDPSKADPIITWMRNGWAFTTTVTHKDSNGLLVKMVPIKQGGKSTEVEKTKELEDA